MTPGTYSHTTHVLSRYQAQLRDVRDQKALVSVLSESVSSPLPGSVGGVSGTGRPAESALLRLERERKRLYVMEICALFYQKILEVYLDQVQDTATRTALYLRYLEGLSWIQIAHRCDCAPDTARMRAKRYIAAHPIDWAG